MLYTCEKGGGAGVIKVIEVSSDTNIGGAGKCLLTLLENFDYTKFEVKVILPQNSLLKEHIERLKIPVIEVAGIADKSLDFKAISALKKVFKSEKPDIVHTHASMSAKIAARFSGAKVIYTRHSVFPQSPKITKGIGKAVNGAVNNYFSDGVIAVAEAAKDNLTETGISEKKIRVILNGVDALEKRSSKEIKDLKKRFGVTNEKVVSIVARLEDIKGHMYFIEAADMLLKKGVNAKFFIAGTGSYADTLKAKVKELNREKDIIFTGFIKDVESLMAITDIQVNASYGTEATSLALLEGMSLGIPAVVSDFGGNPGVIANGENGFIVPQKNAAAIAEKVGLLINDAGLYKTMSENSAKIFNEKFTSAIMTRNTESMYEYVLRR